MKELDLFVGTSVDEDKMVIDSEQLRISELRTIAERANVLLAEKEQIQADLLTVARSAASKKDVHNLNSLVREYLQSPEFLKLQSELPDIAFKQTLTGAPALITCSPVHIKKCLMNLVVNAAEAIVGAGEVTITTFAQHIDARNLRYVNLEDGMYVLLTVCDTGPGISDNDLEHIFDPFYTRKAMGKSGTGLGLTIVWNTIENHGGKIKAESDKNGTCFSLISPLATVSQATGENTTDAAVDRIGNHEKILVVDDEPYLRDIACKMLERLGYNVDSVSSGELAIETIKKRHVDLLVIDMLMEPGINGRETYEKIKQFSPEMRAVIASGFSENKEVQEALRLGVMGYIQKPYSMDQLGEVVKDALR